MTRWRRSAYVNGFDVVDSSWSELRFEQSGRSIIVMGLGMAIGLHISLMDGDCLIKLSY